ncbi:MAG: hypothetical protein CVV25_03045 [Ignavibacteriae bacterium HGW-Ignavibacteriae-4]|jgi:hypothetical protein|nr:MAG: hypothetical protein CVV25_03045 [Ignavibacteriae bacterium HGW-Ignavibacteriae-4]
MKIDKNFTILQEYALEQGELHYDLRSSYDFVKFNRNINENTIDLVFHIIKEELLNKNNAPSITLRFYESSFFKSSENLFLMQNKYIYQLGYVTLEYIEADFLLDENDYNKLHENDDFYIYFAINSNSPLPDSELIIGAPKIRLITE